MKSAIELYAEQVFPPQMESVVDEAAGNAYRTKFKQVDLNADTRRRFVDAVERLLESFRLLAQAAGGGLLSDVLAAATVTTLSYEEVIALYQRRIRQIKLSEITARAAKEQKS